jgi:hypothetical protein
MILRFHLLLHGGLGDQLHGVDRPAVALVCAACAWASGELAPYVGGHAHFLA